MPDALEVEILAKDIEAKYGLPFSSVWSENLTLGELFAITRGSGRYDAQPANQPDLHEKPRNPIISTLARLV